MASKATKKRSSPPNVPAEEGSGGAWRPQVETEREFNPFVNPTAAGEVSTQIGESVWESAPDVQPSAATSPEATTTRRASRKRRPGRKVVRPARKARGSGAVAKGSRVKAKVKAKAKGKGKGKGKGKRAATARAHGAKTGRRGTRSRSARRR